MIAREAHRLVPMVEAQGTEVRESRDFLVAWRGVVYVPGRPRGEPSIAAFLEIAAREGLPAATNLLRGAYALLVLDKCRRQLWGLVDASGNFRLYLTPRGFAPDLLTAAQELDDPARAFTRTRFLRWLAYGLPLAGDSPFEGVEPLVGRELVRLDADGTCRRIPRPSPVPPGDLQRTLETEMQALATALAHDRVSVDLTGGLDSRLVAALLRRFGLAFEAALTGPEDGPEATVAREVARRLGIPLHVLPHRLDDLAVSLPRLLAETGGDIGPAAFHRIAAGQRARLARGCTVAVSGMGGAQLRDQHFAYVFPFIFGKSCDLHRLWRMKFYLTPVPASYFAGEIHPESMLWSDFLRRTRDLLRERKTATIQNLYAHLKEAPAHAGYGTASAALGLPLAIPLHERILLEAVLRTDPWRLMLHHQFRLAIRLHAPELADVRTILGFSCAIGMREMVGDTIHQATFHVRRAWNKLLQRTVGRHAFRFASPALAQHPEFETCLLRSGLLERALAILRELGIVSRELTVEHILPVHRHTFLHAGLLLEHLLSSAGAAPAVTEASAARVASRSSNPS